MKKRVRLYVHRDKDSNYLLAHKLGMDFDSEAARRFSHTCAEVELVVDVDLVTGYSKVVGAEGHFLGEEEYSSGEIEISD